VDTVGRCTTSYQLAVPSVFVMPCLVIGSASMFVMPCLFGSLLPFFLLELLSSSHNKCSKIIVLYLCGGG
jgi:hypothetical protein